MLDFHVEDIVCYKQNDGAAAGEKDIGRYSKQKRESFGKVTGRNYMKMRWVSEIHCGAVVEGVVAAEGRNRYRAAGIAVTGHGALDIFREGT